MEAFQESGMTFGPFNDRELFPIEKSKMLRKCPGVHPVEFVFHPSGKSMLWFVEAKSSSPVCREGNEQEYSRFIEEILTKFEESFQLFLTGILNTRSDYGEIGEKIRQLDYSKATYRFILIINGHQDDWLPPLCESLREKMKTFLKIWNSDVVVMNDVIAKEMKLIS